MEYKVIVSVGDSYGSPPQEEKEESKMYLTVNTESKLSFQKISDYLEITCDSFTIDRKKNTKYTKYFSIVSHEGGVLTLVAHVYNMIAVTIEGGDGKKKHSKTNRKKSQFFLFFI